MAATVVVMLARNLQFLFFSCVLSFTTTTFVQLTLHPTPPPQPLFKDGDVMRKEVKVQVGFQPVGLNFGGVVDSGCFCWFFSLAVFEKRPILRDCHELWFALQPGPNLQSRGWPLNSFSCTGWMSQVRGVKWWWKFRAVWECAFLGENVMKHINMIFLGNKQICETYLYLYIYMYYMYIYSLYSYYHIFVYWYMYTILILLLCNIFGTLKKAGTPTPGPKMRFLGWFFTFFPKAWWGMKGSQFRFTFVAEVLLMVQKSQGQPPGMLKNPS